MSDIPPDKLMFDLEAVFEPDDYLYFYREFLTEERTDKEVEYLINMLDLDKSMKILDRYLCNHCLGSQFAGLLTGYSNEQRGKMIRNISAMMIDSENIDYSKIDPSNFYGFRFRENKKFSKKVKKPGKCWMCLKINILIPKDDFCNLMKDVLRTYDKRWQF